MKAFLSLIILSILTEALTQIVVKSEIIKPLRIWISGKSSWLRELLSCGYCFSFWVSVFVSLGLWSWFGISFTEIGVVNFLIVVLLVHRISNVLHNCIDKYTDKYYDMRYFGKAKEEEL